MPYTKWFIYPHHPHKTGLFSDSEIISFLLVMVMELGEAFLNNKVGYCSVVSQNEITWIFNILDIFRTASPFSKEYVEYKCII